MKIKNLEIKNNVFPAPLAGISDRAYREIVREFGCEIAFTEMITVEGLIRHDRKTSHLLDIQDEKGIVAVQIFGNRPESFAEAAKILSTMNVHLIDINMGCPVKKVVGSNSGVALMKDPERAFEIVSAVKESVELPITVKIRSGWDANTINAVEFAQIVEKAGADAITIHPRTRVQQFRDRSDWTIIKAVKEAVKIPVIGNGDIIVPSDAVQMFEQTNCDAVMIGRGSLGNPWIFKNLIEYFNGKPIDEVDTFSPTLAERAELIRKHTLLMIQFKGERLGLLEMRKHSIWYTKGLRNARILRQALGQLDSLETLNQILAIIN